MSVWSDVNYVDVRRPLGVTQYCQALEAMYVNGGVVSCVLEASPKESFFSADHNDLRGQSYVVHAFVKWLSRRNMFDFLQMESNTPSYQCISGFECEGLLTALLVGGGMYPGPTVEVERARELSRRCMEELFPTSLPSVRAFRLDTSFAKWFNDCGVDTALLVQDAAHARWWVFFATDAD